MREWLRLRFWNWDTLVIWPRRPLSIAQVDQIMREVLLPTMREELNRPCLLLQLIEERR